MALADVKSQEGSHEICVTMSQSMNETRKVCVRFFSTCEIGSNFQLFYPFVLPILLLQTLLYSHSSQRQDIDDNAHPLLSFCYIIRMFDCYFDMLFLHYWPWFRFSSINPAIINLFKINNGNTRTKWEICSKLTIKTPERS